MGLYLGLLGGVQYLFVMLDAFSKFVRLYPIKRATTKVTLNKICKDYINELGTPRRILSDNGTQFTSLLWRNTLERLGIKVLFSSIRHPESNPTERVMRELGKFFRMYCSDQHTKWGKYVNKIQDLLNITTHCSTGFTPFELHFGREPKNEIAKLINFPPIVPKSHEIKISIAKDNLKKPFKERQNKQKTKSAIEYVIGDKVLLRVPHLSSSTDRVTHKFFRLYEGPYVITAAKGSNAFVLSDIKDNKIKGTYNRLSLRKYYQAGDDGQV